MEMVTLEGTLGTAPSGSQSALRVGTGTATDALGIVSPVIRTNSNSNPDQRSAPPSKHTIVVIPSGSFPSSFISQVNEAVKLQVRTEHDRERSGLGLVPDDDDRGDDSDDGKSRSNCSHVVCLGRVGIPSLTGVEENLERGFVSRDSGGKPLCGGPFLI